MSDVDNYRGLLELIVGGFIAGAVTGAFFTWLVISCLIVDRALSQNYEESD